MLKLAKEVEDNPRWNVTVLLLFWFLVELDGKLMMMMMVTMMLYPLFVMFLSCSAITKQRIYNSFFFFLQQVSPVLIFVARSVSTTTRTGINNLSSSVSVCICRAWQKKKLCVCVAARVPRWGVRDCGGGRGGGVTRRW